MAEVIGFKKDGSSTTVGNVTVTKKTAQTGVVKYTSSDNLPDSEDKSVLIYTTDTYEFYVGQGYANALAKMSTDNIIFAASKADFPTTGQSSKKLYIAKDTSVIYVYTNGNYVAISSGEGSVVDPAEVAQIETTLKLKADKTDLAAYRPANLKINLTDMDSDVTGKLNSIPTAYDDTAIKAEVALIQSNKVDSADLASYRKTVDAIKETDLDTALAAKINSAGTGTGGTAYNDTAIKADISSLQTTKADKVDLADYRKTSDAIELADLDGSLSTTINNKADKTELTAFRKTADKIIETDLDTTLTAKISASGTPYDDTTIKAEIATLQTDATNYRKTSDAIKETDLDAAVVTKLNTVGTGGGSGVQIYDYEAVNSVNGEAWIRATGLGVSLSKGTAAAVGGGATTYPMKILTPPAGVKILSARIRFLNTEISTSSPGCAVDWNATQEDNTDNNFNEPLCNVWNDAIGNRTLRSCAQSNSLNNHTITFTGIAAGGDAGVGALVKLIY